MRLTSKFSICYYYGALWLFPIRHRRSAGKQWHTLHTVLFLRPKQLRRVVVLAERVVVAVVGHDELLSI